MNYQNMKWENYIPYLLNKDSDIINLSSGNPIILDPIKELIQQFYKKHSFSENFTSITYQYNDPHGYLPLRKTLAKIYSEEYGFPITFKNILIAPGSQAIFYYFSKMASEKNKKILFPCGAEYPGYRTHEDDMYLMEKPEIEIKDDFTFSYKLSKKLKKISKDILFIYTSRPGNPTGNQLSYEEIEYLQNLCRKNNSYLLVDGAYSPPFPNITFNTKKFPWTENTLFTMSFSKCGLAGERVGVLIANEEMIKKIAKIQSNIVIFSARFSQFIINELLNENTFLKICKKTIKNEYFNKFIEIKKFLISKYSKNYKFSIYDSDGSPFLWLWLREKNVNTFDLFNILRKKKVLLMPSAPFYHPSLINWPHINECFRIALTEKNEKIKKALDILFKSIKNYEKK